MKYRLYQVILIIICLAINIFSQKRPLDLAVIGEQLKDFSLPVYNGSEFQLSNEKGKNVLLVFPRGYYDKDVWCDICAYEYLDLVDEFYNKELAKNIIWI
jgi:peroxiredoxin